MISDFQILGIEPTQDISRIKSAFRKKAKEIHPDINQAQFNNHINFIILQKAYHRLLDGKPQALPPKVIIVAETKNQVEAVKDPAYAFYKAGIKEYLKLHPSSWNKKPKRIFIAIDAKDIQELKETEKDVRMLLRSLPQAYYYFSVVVNEYPESVWAQDARDKLEFTEQQTIRYRKIIESFINHATMTPRVNKMF